MKSRIILLDSEQSTFEVQRNLAVLEQVHPNEVSVQQLFKSDLVLIDYKINDWTAHLDCDVEIIIPADGLTLAHNIRRILAALPDKTPPAVALITNEYASAANPLPRTTQPYTLARLNGIEWVFRKEEQLGAQVESLARACSPKLYSVLEGATTEERLEMLTSYLGIESESDKDDLVEDVAFCAPPIHDLLRWGDGISVLRWLLHRILPYPTMLVADTYIATRAQCNLAQLRAGLKANDNPTFRSAAYLGPGAALFSDRFWRSKLERLFSDHCPDGSTKAIRRFLADTLDIDLDPCEEQSVELTSLERGYGYDIGPLRDCTGAQIDDWPPYASSPWVLNNDTDINS